jgi:hypothetical protein
MEVSNVAFFPAYPAIAALLRYGLNVDTGNALLITAQLAAWGFLELFLSLLRSLECLTCAPIWRRIIDSRASAAFFLSYCLF